MGHSTVGNDAGVKSDESLRALKFGDKEKRGKGAGETRIVGSAVHRMSCGGSIVQVLAECSDLLTGALPGLPMGVLFVNTRL